MDAQYYLHTVLYANYSNFNSDQHAHANHYTFPIRWPISFHS